MKRKVPLRRRSSLPRSRQPIGRNPARKRREFVRTYGSEERTIFVKTLPCAACGVLGFSVNAHVGTEGKGAGRKANADQVAPLCCTRGEDGGPMTLGCHVLYDEHQQQFAARFPEFHALQAAMDCEVAWQRHVEAEATQHSWFIPRRPRDES